MTATTVDVHTLGFADPLPFDVAAERKRLSRSIARLHDPQERAVAAGELTHRATEYRDVTRMQRDQAVYALRVAHGWEPVRIYRTADIPRSRYANILDREERRVNTEGWSDPRLADDADFAAKVAGEVRKGVPEALEELADAAREVRDPAIRALLAAGTGRMSNAALGRMTYVTGQRIAQLRAEMLAAAS